MPYNAIAISGLPGAGKSALLEKLAEKTGWVSHSIGKRFREKLRYLQEIGEVSKDLTIKEYWITVPDEEQIKANRELLELVNKGKIVADTIYAAYLNQATSNPLFVFLTAEAAIRAHRGQLSENKDYNGKTMKEIKIILEGRENDEYKLGMKLFGFDYRNTNYCNLVLDAGKMSIDEEVSAVMKKMRNAD